MSKMLTILRPTLLRYTLPYASQSRYRLSLQIFSSWKAEIPRSPSQLCVIQVGCFRVRGDQTLVDGNKIGTATSKITEEEISKAVSDLTKRLNLDKKEVISVRLGLQEGMRIRGASSSSKKSDSSSLKPHHAIVLISIFIITVLFVAVLMKASLSSPFKALTSISKTDFLAEIPDVTFEDVKGIEEVKQELCEIVQFLQDPERFTNLGAKMPKGALLLGPPGTGKTLLARAIAGEAGVPFYYAAGSEFDEMFVGVGSSRIRTLFADARKNAPCIIFIDEIDACGSTRSSSPLMPYARLTINQLLQEMDGFEAKEGIIVLGATNMSSVLDKALTRPGRFDTQIKVLLPDIKGRQEILELYAKKIIRGKNVDLQKISYLTGGMTGADLSNLVNQAALRAAQLNKSFAEMEDFEYALDKLRLGPELKSRLRTEKELENTAFHEAGHALVAYYTPSAMPIFKVTIGQRGGALGHTSMIPRQEDENNTTKVKILSLIDVAMGGRIAEEMLNGSCNVTTGASNDLKQATDLAYQLVCDFGMSEKLGFAAYDLKKVSPTNKKLIEAEVNSILTASYARAKLLLSTHSSQHKLLAKALLKYETLSLDEMKVLFENNSIEAVCKLRKASSITSSKRLLPDTKELIY